MGERIREERKQARAQRLAEREKVEWDRKNEKLRADLLAEQDEAMRIMDEKLAAQEAEKAERDREMKELMESMEQGMDEEEEESFEVIGADEISSVAGSVEQNVEDENMVDQPSEIIAEHNVEDENMENSIQQTQVEQKTEVTPEAVQDNKPDQETQEVILENKNEVEQTLDTPKEEKPIQAETNETSSKEEESPGWNSK